VPDGIAGLGGFRHFSSLEIIAAFFAAPQIAAAFALIPPRAKNRMQFCPIWIRFTVFGSIVMHFCPAFSPFFREVPK